MSTKDSVDLSGNFSGPDGKAIAENHNLAKIGFKERIGYGVGDLASNLIWTAAGTF